MNANEREYNVHHSFAATVSETTSKGVTATGISLYRHSIHLLSSVNSVSLWF